MFLCCIVEGEERIGKSTYVMKCLNQALDYLAKPKIREDNWREYLGWKPDEVIKTWSVKPSNIKQVGYIWDDAGVWLNNLAWNDPLLKEVQKYMSLVGSDYSFFAMTTPNAKWILNKINKIPGMMRIKIIKTDGSDMIGEMPESKRWSRRATGYEPWYSPDLKKSGVRKVLVDDYRCKMDDDMYKWYQPLRWGYNNIIKERMNIEALSEIKRNELKELQLKAKELRLHNQIIKLSEEKDNLKGDYVNIDDKLTKDNR